MTMEQFEYLWKWCGAYRPRLSRIPKKFTGSYTTWNHFKGEKGAEKETLNLVHVVGAVDAVHVLQGLVVYSLRRPRRLRRPGWWFLAVMAQWIDVRKHGG